MPKKITCITDGCLSERNGASPCSSAGCLACDFPPRPPATGSPTEIEKLAGEMSSLIPLINELPIDVKRALEAVSENYIEGRKETSLELAARIRVDVASVEKALFQMRRFAQMLGFNVSDGHLVAVGP